MFNVVEALYLGSFSSILVSIAYVYDMYFVYLIIAEIVVLRLPKRFWRFQRISNCPRKEEKRENEEQENSV
jgi:hypothetical protein